MEKTNYQKPTTEVYQIQTVNMIAGTGDQGGTTGSGARSFRGSWDDNAVSRERSTWDEE